MGVFARFYFAVEGRERGIRHIGNPVVFIKMRDDPVQVQLDHFVRSRRLLVLPIIYLLITHLLLTLQKRGRSRHAFLLIFDHVWVYCQHLWCQG